MHVEKSQDKYSYISGFPEFIQNTVSNTTLLCSQARRGIDLRPNKMLRKSDVTPTPIPLVVWGGDVQPATFFHPQDS